jgi:hypothetical protein
VQSKCIISAGFSDKSSSSPSGSSAKESHDGVAQNLVHHPLRGVNRFSYAPKHEMEQLPSWLISSATPPDSCYTCAVLPLETPSCRMLLSLGTRASVVEGWP